MHARWTIRNKLLVGVCLLLVMLGMLAFSSLLSVYRYRNTARALRDRGAELPAAVRLVSAVCNLRVNLESLRAGRDAALNMLPEVNGLIGIQRVNARQNFCSSLDNTLRSLRDYQQLLEEAPTATPLGDAAKELKAIAACEAQLIELEMQSKLEDWVLDEVNLDRMARVLERLQTSFAELPDGLNNRILGLHDEVRGQYSALIIMTWTAVVGASLLALLSVVLGYRSVFQPFRTLVKGCRRVAAGDFDYVISLNTQDEMTELAQGMNEMTARFREIRNELDAKVRERTREVIRNEQLASVGFLAAGVAHEINNPLAAIAMCAESMESRLEEVLQTTGTEQEVLRQYFRMIQSESFRCKEITEKLLDFSRLGHKERFPTELRTLVESVVDMVKHLGTYRGKELRLLPGEPIAAVLNSQEVKQVVLNLITNALESTGTDGRVELRVFRLGPAACLEVHDNGCGMTAEVRNQVFEPFFTRRRDGQGTGLGLSISYRIIADHGGRLEAESAGAGQGSTFRMTLPLQHSAKEPSHFRKVA